jgi:hypothetical protein
MKIISGIKDPLATGPGYGTSGSLSYHHCATIDVSHRGKHNQQKKPGNKPG